MKKKIIYVVKGSLHTVPPCVSQIIMLREIGVDVHVVIEDCAEATLQLVKNAGATVTLIGNLQGNNTLLSKVNYWRRYRKLAIGAIKKIYMDGDVIWIGDAGAGIALTDFIKNKKYVLTSLELYDASFIYKYGLKKAVENAQAVISCELNRARIMKQWYNLKEIPFVMPNKPHYEIHQEKSEDVLSLSGKLDGAKFVLYQGVLHKERSLDNIAKAMSLTNTGMPLVIIGKSANGDEDEIIKHLRGIYPDVIYGGYFPAPQHLYITQKAHIGVAFYDDSSLNTMFCAPNKIFEYSKFNIPILGNNIPGLQLTVEKYGAGVCPDMNSPEAIADAINCIDADYEKFQRGAECLYNSVDNVETIRKIVDKLNLN